MQRVAVCCLAVCVVLAGCSGLGGTDNGTTPTASPAPTATSTPTATPTPTPTPSPSEVLAAEELPPGLTPDGIESVDDLMAAHRSNLEETGAVTRLQQSTESDGISSASNSTARIGRDGTLAMVQRAETGASTITTEVYADGPQLYINQSIQGQNVYSSFTSEYYRSVVGLDNSLGQFLRLANFSVTAVDRTADPIRVTLTAEEANTSAFNTTETTIENVSGTLVVDLEGTIHSLSMDYEVNGTGGSVATDVEYAVEERGLASVAAPSWVETAGERSVTADLEYAIEDGVLTITHAGGDAIPADSQILVVGTAVVEGQIGAAESATFFSARLEDDFEAGETVYVYRTDENASSGNATIGERPDEEVAPVTGDLVIQIGDSLSGEIIDVANVSADDDGLYCVIRDRPSTARRGR